MLARSLQRKQTCIVVDVKTGKLMISGYVLLDLLQTGSHN
jgi:hypothetical protein